MTSFAFCQRSLGQSVLKNKTRDSLCSVRGLPLWCLVLGLRHQAISSVPAGAVASRKLLSFKRSPLQPASDSARASIAKTRIGLISRLMQTFPFACFRMVVPGHSLWLEESSRLGSGGIFERGAGGSESGLVATTLFRVNARPRKPITVRIAPPIRSQCGNSIDESRPIYFPFAFQFDEAGGWTQRPRRGAIGLWRSVHELCRQPHEKPGIILGQISHRFNDAVFSPAVVGRSKLLDLNSVAIRERRRVETL
jgi:hypothetical protein